MDDFITIGHGLPQFCVTREPYLVPTSTGKEMYITEGRLDSPLASLCPACGTPARRNGTYRRKIRDLNILGRFSLLSITVQRMRCPSCGRTWSQKIPFADEGHLLTARFKEQLQARICAGATLTSVSKAYGVHPYTLYHIDKEFLLSIGELKKPKQAALIGIDEFLLHDGHRYATVVTDLEDGRILFLEAGKRKQQALDFFKFVGKEWMEGVQAVSMDMNAQYDSAFREEWPHIAIVYDFFHMVKLYNDSVLTKLRRRLQKECQENGDGKGYQLLKGSRFLLLSSMDTVKDKDSKARENNDRLNRDYRSKNLDLPPGERIMDSFRERRLKALLAKNEPLSVAYLLLEQFKLAYAVDDADKLRKGLELWYRLADQSGCPEITTFKKTLMEREDGLVAHTRFHISSGRVEGTNNLIKTIRRQAYGFKDVEYFFLKCMYASRQERFIYEKHTTL